MKRALAIVLLSCITAGCASNPPCKVTPAEVDAARAHAKAEEAKVQMAIDERDRLQRELEEAQAKEGGQEEQDSSKPDRAP